MQSLEIPTLLLTNEHTAVIIYLVTEDMRKWWNRQTRYFEGVVNGRS